MTQLVRLGRRRLGGHAQEALIKCLAVEQAGERVTLAVVEQALVVAVQTQDAADQSHLFWRQRLGGVQFHHANGHPVGGQRKEGDRGRPVNREGFLAQEAAVPIRVVGQEGQARRVGPQRISGGGAVARSQMSTGQPTLRAFFSHAAIDRDGLRPQDVLERTHQGHVQDVTIAKTGQVGQMLYDSGHVPLPKQRFLFFPELNASSATPSTPPSVCDMGSHIAGHQPEQFFFGEWLAEIMVDAQF